MAYWKRKYRKFLTLSEPIILDIETSWNHDYDSPLCWMVSAQVFFNGEYHLYRKPSELMQFYLDLYNEWNLSPNEKVITYIHNASFDLSYLLPYIQRDLPDKDQRTGIFDGEHKIKMYRQGCFEFRCSLMLSATSLEKWGRELNIAHPKKVGLYDYNKILYQDSELSADEQDYDKYDVLSLYECLAAQMDKNNDDITSIPLTSTGYIRRMLRQACYQDKYYRQDYFINNRITDPKHYKCLTNSFAGGYTHGNRLKKSQLHIVDPNNKKIKGKHRDFRSHYPTQIMVNGLPYGKCETWFDLEDPGYVKLFNGAPTIDDILALSPEYSTVSEIIITGMHLKDNNITMPFMQVSKMFNQENVKKVADNGRLLHMYRGSFVTYVDNYTLKILHEQYHIKPLVKYVMRIKNKPVPKPIADVINKLFADKSTLKILHQDAVAKYGETSTEAFDANYNLIQCKKLLNAIYGCMVMNPLRPELDIDYESDKPMKIIRNIHTDQDIVDGLDEYYKGRNNFLPYQAGCFVTAAARYELYEYIKTIGYENIYYCDTDSIFYESTPEIEKKVEALNREKHKKAPYVKDISGKKIYYDVFEEEPDFKAIKYLHSKCYGIVNDQDELVITVAGIPSRTLIKMGRNGKPLYLTREEELAGITPKAKIHKPGIKIKDPYAALDKLDEAFIFHTNTGTSCRYTTGKPQIINIDGHEIETAGGAIIKTLENKIIHDLDCPADNYKIGVW